MQFNNGLFVGAFTAALFAFIGFVLDGPRDELVQEQSLYCEMVTTFNNTGGEFGWPDYKGTYEETCK